jgi:hypothetical protein
MGAQASGYDQGTSIHNQFIGFETENLIQHYINRLLQHSFRYNEHEISVNAELGNDRLSLHRFKTVGSGGPRYLIKITLPRPKM